MPCLLYLPSLVVENESIEMLEGAYVAVILLNQVQFPGDKHRTQRMISLEKVLTDGIFKGYAHAGENVKIAEFLIQKMITLVKELGIEFVKYSKVLPAVPMTDLHLRHSLIIKPLSIFYPYSQKYYPAHFLPHVLHCSRHLCRPFKFWLSSFGRGSSIINSSY